MENRLPNCTGPTIKVGKLDYDGTITKRKQLTMYVCLLRRRLRTLLDPIGGIERLKMS